MAHEEQLLISSIIRSGNILEAIKHGVTPEHLLTYDAEYEWLITQYTKFGQCPSKVAFRTAFPDFTILVSDDLGYAIEGVKKGYARSELTRALKEATEYLKVDDPIEAMNHIAFATRKLHKHVSGDNRVYDLLADWGDVYEDVANRVYRASQDGITGCATGIPTLDGRTSGAQPGDLWLIAARLGQGKTWTLAQMAEGSLVSGKKVLFVSLEQTWRQIALRIHTMLSFRFDYNLRNTALSSGLGVDLLGYKGFLAQLPSMLPETSKLIITDGGRGRYSGMTLASLIEEHEPDVVFIDYITLMSTLDGRPATDDWRAAATISADVKMVAMQYDIPIIAAAQINREGEHGTKPPSVAKLSQSDALGQDASVVVTMRRASAHVAHYSLEKNRHGESGVTFWTKFMPDTGEFAEITYEQALDLTIADDEKDLER